MGVINKVYASGDTHSFKDEVSGYGIFSATQTMPSTTTGATLVATVSYRSMLPSGSFGSTTNVNFYATGGTQSGNDWTAEVVGTNLLLTEGEAPELIDTMPRLPFIGSYPDFLLALTPNIITSSGGTVATKKYTVNVGNIYISYPSGNTTVVENVAHGGTISYSTLISYDNAILGSHSPSNGSNVYSNTGISIVLKPNGMTDPIINPTLPIGGGEVI